MALDVELFRGEARQLVHTEPLIALLKPAFEAETAPFGGRPRFVLMLRNDPGPDTYRGDLHLTNLRADFGYIHVAIRMEGRVVHQKPYSVNGLVGPILARLAREIAPEERHWAFRIAGLPSPEDLPEDASEGGTSAQRLPPVVDGTDDIDISRSTRLAFGIRPAAEPQIPLLDLAEYGVELADTEAPVTVLLGTGVRRRLMEMELSTEIEEGGFLIGRAFRRTDAPKLHAVIVDEVLPAEHSGASLTHFTFTGDSFGAMNRTLGDRQLVGWYHTHLFQTERTIGLSRTDIDLHRDTFRRPWQVAALINITARRRILTCYASSDDWMAPCPIRNLDDDADERRSTRPSLGHH
ncbi:MULTISPECIES: JAB N-terminal domain-containing protein [unclassified Streptomyces]|uniref:JAB N-terminal domain-containing protein n=1 Tax=unclassified Streptomyces TaxID=2593676 RepID=UPI0036DFF0F9